MVFEYILKENGIDPEKDLTIIQNIDFGSTAPAFADGRGDFTIEFEPGATSLESEGKGHVIASLGKDSGYVPYTAFSAKKSYLKENPDVIQRFTNALQKGMDYVRSHSPSETASVIKPQFPETTLEMITTIVTRYYEQDTWKSNLIFEESSFDLLQDILESAGADAQRAGRAVAGKTVRRERYAPRQAYAHPVAFCHRVHGNRHFGRARLRFHRKSFKSAFHKVSTAAKIGYY